MHQPTPHGWFGDVTTENRALAERLMRQVTNAKQVGNIQSHRLTRPLPGGGSVTALSMGGVDKVFVNGPTPSPEDSGLEEWSELDVPMLFSGVVDTTTQRNDGRPAIRLTRQAQVRLSGYGEKERDQPTVPSTVSIDRFKIPYAGRFDEFLPKNENIKHTQYVNLFPTWYSGAMAQVVQIVMGYGKSKFDSKPTNKLETAKLRIPAGVLKKIKAELQDYDYHAFTGKPTDTGQVQYDYKAKECHGVAFGADNKPWLVQINRYGAHAMPLPMVPATTTKAFREWVEEVQDEELLWILERFGGLPSGEPFPTNNLIDAWEKAGVVIKLCDTDDFYAYSPYSAAMGWSFNLRGDTAYNTCFEGENKRYGGVQSGHTYCLSISIGATKERKKPKIDPSLGGALDGYLRSVLDGLRGSDDAPVIRYKMRMAFDVLVQRAKVGGGHGEVDFWRNYELPKLAQCSGSLTRTNTGRLYHPNPPIAQPQIKFPDPALRGCTSFTFSNQGYGKCDTIMHAYFVGDSLKTVKYFFDDTKIDADDDTNFEECMTVGKWERTSYLSPQQIVGNFYLSDIDDRVQTSESKTTTVIVGEDAGYSSSPGFGFDFPFSQTGSIYRRRYYTHRSNSVTTEGYNRRIAVCVPYRMRDAALYVLEDRTNSGFEVSSFKLYFIADPNSYRMYTYDKAFAWRGGGDTIGNKGGVTAISLDPQPVDGNPVYVTGYNYGAAACSDFADSGDWVGALPQDYTWLVHPNNNEWIFEKNDGRPPIKEQAEIKKPLPTQMSYSASASILDQPKGIHTSAHAYGWMVPSPAPNGEVFYRDACKVVAGESIYANCSETSPGDSQYPHWGYTKLADHKMGHCFIGVINE